MNKIAYFLFFCFLVACKEDKQQSIEKTKIVVLEKKVLEKSKKKKKELITDKNVVDKLTAYGASNPETEAIIYTTKGAIHIKLYKDTPLHRANFILLAKSGYLQGCLFSRVVKGFMAQCGGSYDDRQREIQDTIGRYTIPPEMKHSRFHKKGAIGAARSYTNNPKKRSESDEFYFVEGTIYNDLSLDRYEEDNKYRYTERQRAYYKKNPGAAHIDGEHTVFGEIIKGYDIVSKLTDVDTDSRDWPITDLYIDSVSVIK